MSSLTTEKYDLTFTKDTPLDWFIGINNATGGGLAYLILLLATFIPLITVLRREENMAKALIYGGMSGSIVSGLLFFIEALPAWQIVIIPSALLLIGLMIRIFQ